MRKNAVEFRKQVRQELDIVEALLLEKNKAYGNSALSPVRVFSDADATEGIALRIDDKLSRIQQVGFTGLDASEDTLLDLIGYLIILRIALRDLGELGNECNEYS